MAKLEVGGVDHPLEREADAVADRLLLTTFPHGAPSLPPTPVRHAAAAAAAAETATEVQEEEELSEAPIVSAFAGEASSSNGSGFIAQRACGTCVTESDDELLRELDEDQDVLRECATCEAEDELRRACMSCDAEEELQRTCTSREHAGTDTQSEEFILEAAAGRQGGSTSLDFSARTRSRVRAGGTSLPSEVRAFLEPRLGVNLDYVRVYTDAQAGLLAQSINARAFTLGTNVFFAPGEWRPATHSGMRLLAHEVTHTLQSLTHGFVDRQPDTGSSVGLQREIDATKVIDTKDSCAYGDPSLDDYVPGDDLEIEEEPAAVEPANLEPECKSKSEEFPKWDDFSIWDKTSHQARITDLNALLTSPTECNPIEGGESVIEPVDITKDVDLYDAEELEPSISLKQEDAASLSEELELAQLGEDAIEAAKLSILGGQEDLISAYDVTHEKSQIEKDAWKSWGEQEKQNIFDWHYEKVSKVREMRNDFQGRLEGVWSDQSTRLQDICETGEKRVENTIETKVADPFQREIASLKADVDRSARPVAEREESGLTGYRWIYERQQQIETYGNAATESIVGNIYYELCRLVSNVATNQFDGMLWVQETSSQIDNTANAVNASLGSTARQLCAAVSEAVNFTTDVLDDRDSSMSYNVKHLLAAYPKQVLGARDKILGLIQDLQPGFGDVRSFLEHENDVESMPGDTSKGRAEVQAWLDEIPMDQVRSDVHGLIDAGISLAEEIVYAVSLNLESLDGESARRDSTADRVRELEKKAAVFIGCFEQTAEFGIAQSSEYFEQLRLYAIDALVTFSQSLDATEAVESFRSNIMKDMGFGHLGDDDIYSGLKETVEERVRAANSFFGMLPKDAVLYAAGVLRTVVIVILLSQIPYIGPALAVIAIIGLSIAAIVTYAEKYSEVKDWKQAIRLTALDILGLPELQEELGKTEPDYYKAGMLAADTVLVALLALGSAYGGAKLTVRLSNKLRVQLLVLDVAARLSAKSIIGEIGYITSSPKGGFSDFVIKKNQTTGDIITYITISEGVLEMSEVRQFAEVAHEIGHAMDYAKDVKKFGREKATDMWLAADDGTLAYAKNEVSAETYAKRVTEEHHGPLSEELNAQMESYIQEYQKLANLLEQVEN